MSNSINCPSCGSTTWVEIDLVTMRRTTELTARPTPTGREIYGDINEVVSLESWRCGNCGADASDELAEQLDSVTSEVETWDISGF